MKSFLPFVIIILVIVWTTKFAAPVRFIFVAKMISRSINHEALHPVFAVALDDSQQRYPAAVMDATCSMQVINETLNESDSLFPVLTTLADLYRSRQLQSDSPTVIFAPGNAFRATGLHFRILFPQSLLFNCSLLAILQELRNSAADDPAFYNPVRFPTLVSFSLASIGAYGRAVEALTSKFHWSNIAVLHDAFSLRASFSMRTRVREQCRGVISSFRTRPSFYNVLEISIDSTLNDTQRGLERARNHSRIILLCTGTQFLEPILSTAGKDGMLTGEYVFLFLYELEVMDDLFFSEFNLTDAASVSLFRNLFVIRSPPVPWDDMLPTLSSFVSKRQVMFGKPVPSTDTRNEFAVQCYEAVLTVVQVLDESCASVSPNNTQCRSGRVLASKLRNRTFNSTTPWRSFSISSTGSRVVHADIQLFSFTSLHFETVFTFYSEYSELRPVEGPAIEWPLGSPPPDRPACGLDGSKCRVVSWARGVYLPVITALLLAMVALTAGILWRYRHYHDLESPQGWWLIRDVLL